MRLQSLLALATLACVLFAAGPVAAEEQTYLDRRLAQMDEELDLTAEQSVQIRQILDETFARIAADRQQLQGDPEALRDAAGNAIRDADKQIDKILTYDQKEKFVEFRKTGRADIITLDLQEKLDLTEAQTAEVYEILFEAEQKLVEMRNEMRNSGGGRGGGGGGMSRMRDIMEDTDKRIEKVLTDEQKELYQEIVDERRAQMREQMGERGGDRGGRGGRGGGGKGRP